MARPTAKIEIQPTSESHLHGRAQLVTVEICTLFDQFVYFNLSANISNSSEYSRVIHMFVRGLIM